MFKRRKLTASLSRADYRQLEDRRMLAGNVRVAFIDGSVFIRGDNADNSIEAASFARETSGDEIPVVDVVIRGIEGTTVNGQSEVVIPGDTITGSNSDTLISNGFRVNLGRGDDFMRIESLRADGLSLFYGGPGDDAFSSYDARFDALTVQTFTGDDSISLDDVDVFGPTRIFTLEGKDTIGAEFLRAREGIVVSTGEGRDRIAIREGYVTGGDLQVYSGDGSDFVGLQNFGTSLADAVPARIFTGDAIDEVSIVNTLLSGVVAGQVGEFDRFVETGRDPSERLRVNGFESENTAPLGGLNRVFTEQVREGVALATVTEYLASVPELSSASRFIDVAGISDSLDDPDPPASQRVTFFAPIDEAFGELGGTLPVDFDDLMNFHVGIGTDTDFFPTGAALSADDIAAADEIVTRFSGNNISVERTEDGVVLNSDAMFEKTNIRVKNGLIHLIDTVLLPEVV